LIFFIIDLCQVYNVNLNFYALFEKQCFFITCLWKGEFLKNVLLETQHDLSNSTIDDEEELQEVRAKRSPFATFMKESN